MAAMPPLELFVFDLAGTTVVDDGQVLAAFQRTASAFELPVSEATLRARMGWHKEHVFATCLAEAGMDTERAAAMAARFEQEFATSTARVPLRATVGAETAIAALVAAGIGVAFNTGFARNTADLVLRALRWDHFPSVASDEVDHGRPAPDLILRAMRMCGVNDPLMVGVAGDTPADLQAGTAAGCRVVLGVGHGTHSLAELASAPHTHLLPTLAGLPELIDELA